MNAASGQFRLRSVACCIDRYDSGLPFDGGDLMQYEEIDALLGQMAQTEDQLDLMRDALYRGIGGPMNPVLDRAIDAFMAVVELNARNGALVDAGLEEYEERVNAALTIYDKETA